jgi:hypothetical protein
MTREDGEVSRVVDGFIEREAAMLQGRRSSDVDGDKVLAFLAGIVGSSLVWAIVLVLTA